MRAPVPLASASWRTASARPSLRSIAAEAARVRPARSPRRSRGSGRRKRATASATAGSDGVSAPRSCCSQARPAAAPPTDPDTYSSSPARPPERVSTFRRLAVPDTVTSITSGPGDRVTLPPTRCVPVRAASARKASSSASSSASGSASGSISESSAVRGSAPIAARSLRLAASTRCPIAPGVHEAPIEVHALDGRVGGDDVEPVARRLEHRRVVADADDDERRRRRHPCPHPRDHLPFARLTNCHACSGYAASWQGGRPCDVPAGKAERSERDTSMPTGGALDSLCKPSEAKRESTPDLALPGSERAKRGASPAKARRQPTRLRRAKRCRCAKRSPAPARSAAPRAGAERRREAARTAPAAKGGPRPVLREPAAKKQSAVWPRVNAATRRKRSDAPASRVERSGEPAICRWNRGKPPRVRLPRHRGMHTARRRDSLR